jgi:branched-chain amino acid transport system ATP-binding protein
MSMRLSSRASDGAGELRVSDVTLRFKGVTALSSVSFEVEPSTIHAVIGPNGAGKSSMFNVLSGVYRAQEGSVRLNGTEIIGMAPHRIARLGAGRAFQNASMFQDLTVEEHLMFGQHRFGRAGVIAAGMRLPSARRDEASARATAREMAEYLGLQDHLATVAATLPYGLQKRVDLGRALTTEPNLLLLDEPAAGLHTHEKAALTQLIKRVAQERSLSVLLVEHDMTLVMTIADAITVLDFGNVIASEAPTDVAANPQVIAAYLGSTKESA